MILYNKEIFENCFCYNKKYWYLNIKMIPTYFKRLHFLIKNGYDMSASWETFSWFTNTMKSILLRYKEKHYGVPILIENYPIGNKTEEDKALIDKNEALWNETIDNMISLLDDMNELNPKYDDMEILDVEKSQEKAKDEFFKLFSEHFYRLWD